MQSVWASKVTSQEMLRKALQEWCQQAEETGIAALQEFSRRVITSYSIHYTKLYEIVPEGGACAHSGLHALYGAPAGTTSTQAGLNLRTVDAGRNNRPQAGCRL